MFDRIRAIVLPMILVLFVLFPLSGCRSDLRGETTLAPSTGIIRGDLGYPSDWVPPMVVYAENTLTGDIFFAETNSSPLILSYGLEVSAPGNYIVYAWTKAGTLTDESLGSYYLGGDITGLLPIEDFAMKEISVTPGETVTGIDIFHFGELPRRVPLPPSAYRRH